MAKSAEIGAQIWQCGKYAFDLTRPIIMGILNLTPDSFSDGGSYQSVSEAVQAAQQMMAQGAAIIDVGGESTRPGSDEVLPEEELKRIMSAVERLVELDIPVSVDTRHSEVASSCVEAGVAVINDITGFTDSTMVNVAVQSNCGLLLMHMKGQPKSMQSNTEYDDLFTEVKDFFALQVHILKGRGVSPDRIALDPGPGFGKTAEQSLAILHNIGEFAIVNGRRYPLVAAYSRKSCIGALSGIEHPANRDQASAQAAACAYSQGAQILRVHNVKVTVEALCNG